MAACLPTLLSAASANTIGQLEPLLDEVITPIAFTRTSSKPFLVIAQSFVVVSFVVDVRATPATSFSFAAIIYRVLGQAVTEVGRFNCTEQVSTFSKEFTAGTYVICFQSTTVTTFDGTILADYQGFQKVSYLSTVMGAGEQIDARVGIPRPPSDCQAVLFYEILEGALPPGMRMTALGQIKGVAPNLDCVADNAELPPSQNWSFKHNDGTYHPWGRQWRFKVRVSIAGLPDVIADEWFCVKVHNNWSIDRDNFLSYMPFKRSFFIEDQVEPLKIPVLCVPVADMPAWSPIEIEKVEVKEVEWVEKTIEPECESCQGSTAEEVTQLLTIPNGLTVPQASMVKQWLQEMRADKECCLQYGAFLDSIESSPLFQLALRGRAIVEVAYDRTLKIRTYTDDPQVLWWKWRNEETQRLPLGAEVVMGETLSINIK